ncbi:MAG: hypothetical protein ACKOB0_04610 [Chthoniobacterales bacterium]
MVKIVNQLAVFIKNKPGTLAAVCETLAKEGINIWGLATMRTSLSTTSVPRSSKMESARFGSLTTKRTTL